MKLMRLLSRSALAMAVGAAATLVVVAFPQTAAATSNPKPNTIPALQEWAGAEGGSFSLNTASRIVTQTTSATTLASTAATFQADLRDLTGRTLPRATGTTTDVRPGDIYLALGSADTQLGTEGYRMDVTDAIRITARDDKGAFYGTRTILQLLKQSPAIPQGTARDWPVKPERGLMVDNGRKYFTPQWLRDHVKELAYLKMNYFHLHLSDNLGFRIESTSHPEIVTGQHLTKAEVRDLIALAAQYKITIVPEFDAPGHMRTTLAAHPELRLVNKDGVAHDSYIDLGNPAAYTFLKELYDEYLDLFPGPYFHIGADEYHVYYSQHPHLIEYAKQRYGANAVGKDVYLGFINWANDIVRARGKTTRAWNDGIGGGTAVTVNPNIILDFWYNYGKSPQAHIDAGHRISNESWYPTYMVLGSSGISGPNTASGYEAWDIDTFQGSQTIAAADKVKNLGSKIHIWCDVPDGVTEERVASHAKDSLRMLAQRTWGSPKLKATWAEFAPIVKTIGRNPSWPSSAQAGNLAAGKPATTSGTDAATNQADNAFDSDYHSRWSSAYSNNQWLQVDLGSVQAIDRVKLFWESAYGKGYQIQTSNDAVTWTTIRTVTAGDGGTDDLTDLTGTGRYVRMQGVERATAWGYSLYEMEVYGPPNLAAGKPVTVSSSETTTLNGPKAVDSDLTTRWASAYSNNEWITVDLGTSRSIGRVKLLWEKAYGTSYQIQTSNDNATWTTIRTVTAGDGGTDELTGLTGTGRYVRMQGTQRATSFGYSLYEFEVYTR